MILRFVAFEEIDKRKWNGTVYSAPNGNISGYYWFLKSVLKEWDALIEGDYQSVMPVLRYEPSEFQMEMLSELGPYTVNALTTARIQTFYEAWKERAGAFSYPFNYAVSRLLMEKNEPFIQSASLSYFELSDSYEQHVERYSHEIGTLLKTTKVTDYMFSGQERPEEILKHEKLSDKNNHILYRLMYNAIQRGSGWHAKVSHQYKPESASAFYISDHRSIRMLYKSNRNDPTCWAILQDTFLKGNAGRPMKLYVPKIETPYWGTHQKDIAVFMNTSLQKEHSKTRYSLFNLSFLRKAFRK